MGELKDNAALARQLQDALDELTIEPFEIRKVKEEFEQLFIRFEQLYERSEKFFREMKEQFLCDIIKQEVELYRRKHTNGQAGEAASLMLDDPDSL